MWINSLSFGSLFFVLSVSLGYCQSQLDKEVKFKLPIEECSFKNQIVMKEVKNYISHQKEIDTLFKNRGYLQVVVDNLSYRNNLTLNSYAISKQYVSMDDIDDDNIFPNFYFKVSGKPVLIYIQSLKQVFNIHFDKKSKKKIQRLIEPFLTKARSFNVVNDLGEKTRFKKYRKDEKISVHGGKTIFIFKDPFRSPVIVDNQ